MQESIVIIYVFFIYSLFYQLGPIEDVFFQSWEGKKIQIKNN